MMKKFMGSLGVLVLVLSGGFLQAQEMPSAVLHKDPWCGCCNAYADYLEEHGIKVKRVDHADMRRVKNVLGTAQAATRQGWGLKILERYQCLC